MPHFDMIILNLQTEVDWKLVCSSSIHKFPSNSFLKKLLADGLVAHSSPVQVYSRSPDVLHSGLRTHLKNTGSTNPGCGSQNNSS